MFQLSSSLVLHLTKRMLTPMSSKITLLLFVGFNIISLSLCFAKYQIIWFAVLTKPFNRYIPDVYQIFHIYQIKNLCTKHFENIANVSFAAVLPTALYWYIYAYQFVTLLQTPSCFAHTNLFFPCRRLCIYDKRSTALDISYHQKFLQK